VTAAPSTSPAPQGDVLWLRQAEIPAGDGGELPDEADVAVVGGGYTGMAAARELARSGRSVVLVEQGGFGHGASGRNAGFAHAGVRRSLPELRRRFGDGLGRELYRETQDALDHVGELIAAEGIDCDHETHGYLYLADGPRAAHRLAGSKAALDEAGHTSTLLSGTEVAAQAGAGHYSAGLLLDGAASVHPARFVSGLAHAARAAGAALHDHTRVTALAQRPGGVELTTTRGAIRARHALVATDGYTGGLLPSLRRRIVPIDSFIVATAPLDAAQRAAVSPRGHLCLETKNFLCYWRLARDGRLIFGGRASFAPTSVERASRWLRDRMSRIYPSLAGVEFESAWGGKTGFSLDQLPHLGRQGDITYAGAYCGGGVALATWFGTRAARWIAGGPAPPFARIPFRAVPLYHGRPWFLPFVGPFFALQDRLR
jgi:glycine/D-amino acid oxidase-like deaminating enzyme